MALEPFQGHVERQQIDVRLGICRLDITQLQSLAVASGLDTLLVSGSFDENTPHCFRGRGKEMAPTIPLWRFFGVDKTQIGLVNQGRCVQSLAGSLVCELV